MNNKFVICTAHQVLLRLRRMRLVGSIA